MQQVLDKLSQIERLLNTDLLLKKELLTLEEAAHLTDVSKSTIYKWVSSRKLSHYKPSGKLVFIKREDLYEFITRNKYSNRNELMVSGALSNADKSLKKLNGTNC